MAALSIAQIRNTNTTATGIAIDRIINIDQIHYSTSKNVDVITPEISKTVDVSVSKNLTFANESEDWNLNYNLTEIDHNNLQFQQKIGPLAYVANGGVLIIDTSTHTEIAQLTLKYGASQIAISPDDSILYAVAGGKQLLDGVGYVDQSFLTLINTTTNKEMGYVDLGYNRYPRQIAAAPDGRVYISWERTGDQYPGYTIFDFKQNLKWEKQFGEYNEYLASSFAFNSDGSYVYIGMMRPYASIYEIDWNTNKVYVDTIYPQMSMIRSITATKNGQTAYYASWYDNKLGYVRGSDGNLQVWNEEYDPTAVAYDIDKSVLYVVGEKNKVPKLYRITGLMGISTVGASSTENFITSDASSFYTSSTGTTLQLPSNTIPAHITITPDGKYLYITTLHLDNYGMESNGEIVIVCDAQTLQKVATINSGGINRFSEIAMSKQKIIWNPTPEFEIIDGIMINNQIDMASLIATPYVMSRNPASDKNEVPINSQISITFSKEIDPTTVDDSTFIILNSHYYPINGTRHVLGNTVYFIPSENYTKNSKVFVTVTNNIKGTNNANALRDDFNFTTGNSTRSFVSTLDNFEIGTTKKGISIMNVTYIQDTSIHEITIHQIGYAMVNGEQIQQQEPLIEVQQLNVEDLNISIYDTRQTGISQQTTVDNQEPGSEIMINPQPEPPGTSPNAPLNDDLKIVSEEEQMGNDQMAPGSAVTINPQPEPPKPAEEKGIVEMIIDFFTGIFGW